MRSFLQRLHLRMRAARADLFIQLMRPQPNARVLDLGGGDGSFASQIAERSPIQVTLADPIDRSDFCRARGFRFVQIPDDDANTGFSDQEFDIVLCNSVIEHVTLPKADCIHTRFTQREWRSRSLAAQAAFAREIMRIGQAYFVQTPHRDFPFELHTWLPFVNWLPHEPTRRLVRFTDRFWIKQCGYADWNLLGSRQMKVMFPGAQIHLERAAGWPKSIIAYRR